ncbi:MAG: hypothetical protein AAGA65_06855 [Actinomycetota bacterium]
MTLQRPDWDPSTLPPGMHPAMLPEEPPSGRNGRREGALMTVAAVVGAVVVLAGLLGFQQWRSDDEPVAAGTSDAAPDLDESEPEAETSAAGTDAEDTDTETDDGADRDADPVPDPIPDVEDSPDAAPSDSGSDVVPVACPAQYDQVICDAAAYVQQERGRPFKEFPTIELLDDAEFDQAVLSDFDEYQEDLVEDERVLKVLGLIPTDLNLVEAFRSLLESGVLGFYDPETKRLVVRGGEFDLFGQSILVHELVHAFDDQWFDLNRPDYENDDQEYAFIAVVEGNASRLEDRWRDRLSPEDQATLNAQEFSSLSVDDLNRLRSLPEVIIQLQVSPYVDGQRYVERLEEVGGEDAIDDSLTVAPVSSEEILHEGNLFEDDLVIVDLSVPPADGPTLSQGALGELMLQFWLGEQAAAGWGGDQYVVWDDGGRTCLTADLAADTATDLLEMETAIGRWQQGEPTLRSVTTVATADRTIVRATGCY